MAVPSFPLAVRTSARARFSYEKKKNEGTAEDRENTTAKVIRQRGKIYGGLIIVCLASPFLYRTVDVCFSAVLRLAEWSI